MKLAFPTTGLSLDSISITERGTITLNILGPNVVYYSPERLAAARQNYPPSPSDDMWALGCILLQLVENKQDGILPPKFPIRNHAKSLSDEGVQLIGGLLNENVQDRLAALHLVNNNFLTNRQSFFAQVLLPCSHFRATIYFLVHRCICHETPRCRKMFASAYQLVVWGGHANSAPC